MSETTKTTPNDGDGRTPLPGGPNSPVPSDPAPPPPGTNIPERTLEEILAMGRQRMEWVEAKGKALSEEHKATLDDWKSKSATVDKIARTQRARDLHKLAVVRVEYITELDKQVMAASAELTRISGVMAAQVVDIKDLLTELRAFMP